MCIKNIINIRKELEYFMENIVEKIYVEKIEKKLKIIAWLENLRWECAKKNQYDLIKYYCNDGLFNFVGDDTSSEAAEAILLTHYLVYICDRQMPYEDIFKAGGYTISALVKNFIEQRKKGIYQKENTRKLIRNLINKMVESEKKNNGNGDLGEKYSYYLCNNIEDNEKEHIKKYFEYKSMKERAKFSSRFMITDLLCIYKTLVYLCEKFEGSFIQFLNYAIGNQNEEKPVVYDEEARNKIYSLAYSMYRLTYQLIPQVKGNEKNICNILKQEKYGVISLSENSKKKENTFFYKNSKTTKKYLGDNPEIEEKWYINEKTKPLKKAYTFNENKYDSKRLWCVARDFIYHPIFSKCFEIVTGEKVECLQKDNANEFELPGDVWNNNLKFAKCFWFNNQQANDKFKDIEKSSKFVRELYEKKELSNWKEKNKEIQCYPKDFDITFNFVPNMCSKDKCENCPLCNKEKFDLKEYCHKQKGKLCAFILYATGLEYVCKGKDCCELLKLQNNNSNKIT